MARRNQNINLKTTIGNQLQYIYSADELTNVLNDVAKQIGVQAGFRTNQLQCFADTSKDDRRTTRYRMRKKHGGTRAIVAPHSNLLFMLQAFNALLQDFYVPTPWCYGFVRDKSVAQNAQQHVGKRYILNIDLKDFFPSITRQMVEDVLLAEPIKCSTEAARLLSGLCTATEPQGDVLPQGFPTSPTLSNMVCRKMDEELAVAAQSIGATYTRYADDMTFSSDNDVLRTTGSFYMQVSTIVEKYGFRLNERKTRLQRRGRRQQVTGVVVSDKVNVTREYARQIRTLLYMWERYGYEDASEKALWNYRNQHGKTKGHSKRINLSAVLRGRLSYMKMVKGEADPTYLKLWNKYCALHAAGYPKSKTRKRGMRPANDDSMHVGGYLGDPPRRGCALVITFFALLAFASLLVWNLYA